MDLDKFSRSALTPYLSKSPCVILPKPETPWETQKSVTRGWDFRFLYHDYLESRSGQEEDLATAVPSFMCKPHSTWRKAGLLRQVERSKFMRAIYSESEKIRPLKGLNSQPCSADLQIRIISGIQQKHSTSTTPPTPIKIIQMRAEQSRTRLIESKKTRPLWRLGNSPSSITSSVVRGLHWISQVVCFFKNPQRWSDVW